MQKSIRGSFSQTSITGIWSHTLPKRPVQTSNTLVLFELLFSLFLAKTNKTFFFPRKITGFSNNLSKNPSATCNYGVVIISNQRYSKEVQNLPSNKNCIKNGIWVQHSRFCCCLGFWEILKNFWFSLHYLKKWSLKYLQYCLIPGNKTWWKRKLLHHNISVWQLHKQGFSKTPEGIQGQCLSSHIWKY